jgi:hypothetical protein
MVSKHRCMTMISAIRTAVLAAIAAGLALTSPARANIISNFTGTCTSVCTGTVTGVLTLTDAYVPGTGITSATFVSFSYMSSFSFLSITSAFPSIRLLGGLDADGSLSRVPLIIQVNPNGFSAPSFARSSTGSFGVILDIGTVGPGTEEDPRARSADGKCRVVRHQRGSNAGTCGESFFLAIHIE